MQSNLETLKSAVVRVGKGRGFLVDSGSRTLIITAAHCLPRIPEAYSASDVQMRCYPSLVSQVGSSESLPAECIFADPTADIAVLCSPDRGGIDEDFGSLFKNAVTFKIEQSLAEARAEEVIDAVLLSLEGQWTSCKVRCVEQGPLWIEKATDGIWGGMSGSPIVDLSGSAIGVVCTGRSAVEGEESMLEGGPNPHLAVDLPARILRTLPKDLNFMNLRAVTGCQNC